MMVIMKIGILGSGTVALTLAEKFLKLDQEVMISSRNLDTKKKSMTGDLRSPTEWARMNKQAHAGSFKKAAQFGEVIFNCTKGSASLQALQSAERASFKNKILIDIANPLDFSTGTLALTVSNSDSLAEQIQRAYPDTKVVKTLNTVNVNVMVNPTALGTKEHDMFVCGNDKEAKKWVSETLLVKWLGWENIIDLGDLSGARAMEMYLFLWMRLFSMENNPWFNIHIVKKSKDFTGDYEYT